MPTATHDTFLTAEELAENLGLGGAQLEPATLTHLNHIRQTAIADLEGVLELFLTERQQGFYGTITARADTPFSVVFTDHIVSIASMSYRKSDDSAIEKTGIINANDLTFESLPAINNPDRRFLQIHPATTWPADCHESGEAFVNLNVGIDAALVPLLIKPRHKEYLLLRASGYFDSRIVASGDTGGGTSSLDHDLARRLALGLAPAPTPTWERMKAATMEEHERIYRP